jgi:hypothetical protein
MDCGRVIYDFYLLPFDKLTAQSQVEGLINDN